MTATTPTRERSLTPPEVQDRTAVLLHLLDEQDTIRFRVRASRDELREWRVEARKLATQIDEVRQQIRTGIVTESAQPDLPHMDIPANGHTVQRYGAATLGALTREAQASVALDHDPECGTRSIEAVDGLDGASDEPDDATDPPPREPNRGVEIYRMFDANYPAPKTKDHLYAMLARVLTPAEYALLPESCPWRPGSGQFDAVAHWARVENAHQVHAARPPTSGLTLPARLGMPLALAQALATSEPKAKAPRKKAPTRKAKP